MRQGHTRFSLRDDDGTTLENSLEFSQVEITVGSTRRGACRYDSLFDGKLNDERL